MPTIGAVHMLVLAYFAEHEGASLTTAAATLGLPVTDVERFAAELVAAEFLEAIPLR